MHTSQIKYLAWFHYGFELGQALYGLSISYIVSCIFYFIVVYLPEQSKRRKAMSIIENRIDNILGEINVLVHYYIRKHKIDITKNKDLTKQFSSLNKIDHDKFTDFKFQILEKQTGNLVKFGTGALTEEGLFLKTKESVEINIERIFQIPVILNVDHDLILILEQIRSSSGLSAGSTRLEMHKYFTPEQVRNLRFDIPELGKDLLTLYRLHQELSKYINPTKYQFIQANLQSETN